MTRIHRWIWLLLPGCLVLVAAARGQENSAVTGQVRLDWEEGSAANEEVRAVVWLSPADGASPARLSGVRSERREIVQRDKRFEPDLLAVEVGTVVDFPNLDPFFHNVFSLYNGTRFDLLLYEAGATRSVPFDRPGICYIFCNIHSEMSAVVVVVDSPWFVVASVPGEFRIDDVPRGRYRLQVWAERGTPESLETAGHELSVGSGVTVVDPIALKTAPGVVEVHANKYGREYDPPVFASPIYSLP